MATEIQASTDSTNSATARVSQACVSCRRLKIRCVRGDEPEGTPCENCRVFSKDCIFVPVARTRRRKRTDLRVSELEVRVRELTSMLDQETEAQSKKQQDLTLLGTLPAFLQTNHLTDAAEPSATEPMQDTTAAYQSGDARSSSGRSDPADTMNLLPADRTGTQRGDDGDVIDRGLLSWEMALQLFERYQTELLSCYPIVPVASDIDVAYFRREKPIVFLAMITAAAATAQEQLRDELHESILHSFAILVMVEGRKSLEILQAMLITVAWYRPCGTFNDTKYLQYSQAALLMAQELGLDRNTVNSAARLRDSRQLLNASLQNQPDDINSIESQRTLVASYCQSSSKALSTSIGTMQYERDSIAACLRTYRQSSQFSTYDHALWTYARCQLLTQEALASLQERSPRLQDLRVEDSNVTSILSLYDRQLEGIVGTGHHQVFLEIAIQAGILRVYEIALYQDYSAQDFRPPFSLDTVPEITCYSVSPAYLATITRCRTSAVKVLEALYQSDLITLSAMPAAGFVRMMYSLTILYKIYLLLTSPNHPLATLIDAEELCLPNHLSKMHRIMSMLDYHHSFHGANKYLTFVKNLQGHVVSQRGDLPSDHNSMEYATSSLEGWLPGHSSVQSSNPTDDFSFPDSMGLLPEDLNAEAWLYNEAMLQNFSAA